LKKKWSMNQRGGTEVSLGRPEGGDQGGEGWGGAKVKKRGKPGTQTPSWGKVPGVQKEEMGKGSTEREKIKGENEGPPKASRMGGGN